MLKLGFPPLCNPQALPVANVLICVKIKMNGPHESGFSLSHIVGIYVRLLSEARQVV